MKNIKLSNLFLVVVVVVILIGGFIKTLLFNKEIIEYENRGAYNYKKPTIKTIVNKEFQDNIELTLGDQIPFATLMKRSYNTANSIINYVVMKKITADTCKNNYISILSGLTVFGCDDVIVYSPRDVESVQTELDSRIENINKFIGNTNLDVYVYYIEKDTDVIFNKNKQTNISEYIMSNIETENKHIFEINNFDEFTRDFYKTDHHWNLDGSYRGYLELTELLKINTPLKPGEKTCIPNSFTGSKANVSGAGIIFKEDFCIYNYDISEHTITINDEVVESYSARSIDDIGVVSYSAGYGGDYAEIVFDYNQENNDNILIFGESYDNAIIELIASHYNKTYSIDLRHYERQFGKKFNFTEFVEEKGINKVIFIGNVDFFVMEEFNVEVK